MMLLPTSLLLTSRLSMNDSVPSARPLDFLPYTIPVVDSEPPHPLSLCQPVFSYGWEVGPAARVDPSPGGACHLIPRITEIWDLETCKGIDHFLMLVMVSLLLWVGNVVSRSFSSAESPFSDLTAQTLCLLIQACGIDKAPKRFCASSLRGLE